MVLGLIRIQAILQAWGEIKILQVKDRNLIWRSEKCRKFGCRVQNQEKGVTKDTVHWDLTKKLAFHAMYGRKHLTSAQTWSSAGWCTSSSIRNLWSNLSPCHCIKESTERPVQHQPWDKLSSILKFFLSNWLTKYLQLTEIGAMMRQWWV